MSTCSQCPAVRISCSGQTGITSWQSWPTSGLSACPAPRNQSLAQFQLFRQACLSPPRNAMHLTASGSRPIIFTIKHARQPTCAACQIARGIRIKSMRRRLVQTVFSNSHTACLDDTNPRCGHSAACRRRPPHVSPVTLIASHVAACPAVTVA